MTERTGVVGTVVDAPCGQVEAVPGRWLRRRHGRLQLFGCGDRSRARARREAGAYADRPSRTGSGGSAIDVRPLDFDDVIELTASLRGVTTLYNTYWVRFPQRARRPRARRGQPAHLVPRGTPCGRRAHRARVDHAPEHLVALRLLSGQGRGRACAGRGGRALRRAPSRHPLRRRRRPAQQHRVAAAPAPGLRRRRHRRVPDPGHPHR